MARVLMPIPSTDFDPTETAIPWKILTEAGHDVRFATPDGAPGRADERMVRGVGLGLLAPVLQADANARAAYARMIAYPAFLQPIRHDDAAVAALDGLVLPGGHAKGMRPYLESMTIQSLISERFQADKPVGAICHGTVVTARAKLGDRSVLHGRRTTALTRQLELTGWALTAAWLGDYYRTYPETVEDEVTRNLARPEDFVRGPLALLRDSPERLDRGFTVRDGNYLSARWPGDAHRFATEFAAMLPR